MGYRTNGTWVIKGPVEQIIAAWTTVRLTITLPNDPDNSDISWDEFKLYRIDNTGYIRFSFEGWKWYSGYKSIGFYESVWSCLSELCEKSDAYKGIAGKRIHIGEDNATEEDQFGDDGDVEIFVCVKIDDDEPKSGEPLTTKDTPCTSQNLNALP